MSPILFVIFVASSAVGTKAITRPIGSVDHRVWADCLRAQEELRTTLGGNLLGNVVSSSLFFVDYGSSGLDRNMAMKANHIATYKKSIPKMIASLKLVLPGWVFVCFYDSSVPQDLLTDLISACEAHGVQHAFIKMGIPSYFRSGTFWRYLTADVFNVSYFRDIELPFTTWDLESINDFVNNRAERVAYVHMVHQRTWSQQRIVLGGLFMVKGEIDMNSALRNWRYWHSYGADEVFLSYYIHPRHRIVVYYEPRVKRSVEAITELAEHETRIQLSGNWPGG